MKKNGEIPLFKQDAYHTSYLKAALKERKSVASPVQHFEMHRRCLWKDTIQPHRLDFYLVFLVTAGEGIHTFGIKEHYIKENMLCFVGPHMISSWHAEVDEHRGIFCTFSEEFFNADRQNKQFLSELPFFQIDGNAVLHLSDEQMQYYLSLFTMMDEEYQQRNEFSADVLRSQLQVLLYKAHAQFLTQNGRVAEANHAGLRLLRAFTTLYRRDFNRLDEGHEIQLNTVAGYADELGVSQNHLNDTIKVVTGRSAGQLIRKQLIKHATMCLKHSAKSISEIAYRLGYDDPSYFARYYKSQTGHSPSEVRAGDKL